MWFEVTGGLKSKVDARLEMVVCGANEILELECSWNDGAGSGWLRSLLESVGIHDVLDFVNGGCEATSMALNGRGRCVGREKGGEKVGCLVKLVVIKQV